MQFEVDPEWNAVHAASAPRRITAASAECPLGNPALDTMDTSNDFNSSLVTGPSDSWECKPSWLPGEETLFDWNERIIAVLARVRASLTLLRVLFGLFAALVLWGLFSFFVIGPRLSSERATCLARLDEQKLCGWVTRTGLYCLRDGTTVVFVDGLDKVVVPSDGEKVRVVEHPAQCPSVDVARWRSTQVDFRARRDKEMVTLEGRAAICLQHLFENGPDGRLCPPEQVKTEL